MSFLIMWFGQTKNAQASKYCLNSRDQTDLSDKEIPVLFNFWLAALCFPWTIYITDMSQDFLIYSQHKCRSIAHSSMPLSKIWLSALALSVSARSKKPLFCFDLTWLWECYIKFQTRQVQRNFLKLLQKWMLRKFIANADLLDGRSWYNDQNYSLSVQKKNLGI